MNLGGNDFLVSVSWGRDRRGEADSCPRTFCSPLSSIFCRLIFLLSEIWIFFSSSLCLLQEASPHSQMDRPAVFHRFLHSPASRGLGVYSPPPQSGLALAGTESLGQVDRAEGGSAVPGGASGQRKVARSQPRPYLCKPIRSRVADKSGQVARRSASSAPCL